MKKYVLIIAILFISALQLTAEADSTAQPAQVYYAMPTPKQPPVHNQTYNRIIIQSGNNTYITTSPRYPKQSYAYKDFETHQRYPHRNHYIPSYCMHDSYIYYGNGYNPFCSQYRRYGNGMYINF